MTILTNPPESSVNVLRAGHAELLVTDLNRARGFYIDLLGFVETASNTHSLYLRCLDDRQHHSLVLRRAPRPGAAHLAFRVGSPDDLDRLSALAREQFLPQRWVDDEEQVQGRALRLQDPSGLPLEFYHAIEPATRMVQPYHQQRPVQVMRLDHFSCQVSNAGAAVGWYQRELGFRVSEYIVKETPQGDRLWAAWLHRRQSGHDLTLMNGLGPRLHHIGFWLPDASMVQHACDQLAAGGYSHAIERGPGRHSLSNALFLYLRDPDGNRIELRANDSLPAEPAAEPVRWTLNDPRRAALCSHAASPSWFDEAMPVHSIANLGFMPLQPPLLHDQPDHAA